MISDFELAGWADGVADLVERTADHPLTCWRAWDRPDDPSRTSQRRAAAAMARSKRFAVLGGNRSGKTDLNRALFVCMVLGADHPDVQVFADINGLDISQWPTGPGLGWFVALSSNDSRAYHRNEIDRLLEGYPRKWYNRNGNGEARLYVTVPGYAFPAEIWFKAQDQGRRAFQGAKPRIISLDEEGEDPALLAECEARLIDLSGYLWWSFTPGLRGFSWAWELLEKGGPTPPWRTARLYSYDNPHVPEADARALGGSSVAEQAIRQRGEWTSKAGRVWPGFKPEIHTYDPATRLTPSGVEVYPPGDDVPVYVGFDYGFHAPNAVVLGSIGPDGALYIRAEHQKTGESVSELATAIRALPNASRIVTGWGDRTVGGILRDLSVTHNIPIRAYPDSTRDEQIAMVSDLFVLRSGRPRVVIDAAACPLLIRYLLSYQVETDRSGERTERPLKRDDHLPDAFRYLVAGLVRGYWIAPLTET